DMRDAPSIAVIQALQDAGATIRGHDPKGMEKAQEVLNGVSLHAGPYEAAAGAHAIVIMTEWESFRALNFERLGSVMADPLLVDLRNVYRRAQVAKFGFRYVSIGRPAHAIATTVPDSGE
ncbi:MAG: UDP binding domain-containing protein, partial [Bosea sp. (in: a-proteobacteria)]